MEDQDRTPGKPARLRRAQPNDGIYVATYDADGNCLQVDTWIVKRRLGHALETIPPGRFALDDGYPIGVVRGNGAQHAPDGHTKKAIDPTHRDAPRPTDAPALAQGRRP
jgi:hypothetical protein